MIAGSSSWLLSQATSVHPDLAPTLAVVPVLVGPLQVLLTLLPALFLALGGGVLALFRPSGFKKGIRLAWRLKVPILVTVAIVVGAVIVVPRVLPGRVAGISQEEASSEAWPMFRGSLLRCGTTSGNVGPTQGAVNWSFAGDVKTFYSSPAVVGNRIYICSADKGVFRDSGAIYCLDADSGGVVWKSAPEGFRATFSSPAIWGKYLVCGEGLHFTRDARVVCLDVSNNGALLWQYRTASHVESSPCISGGRVYVGAGDDGYYCFELKPDAAVKAQIAWHVPGDRYPDAETAPAVHDGKVYVGLGMGGKAVCCLDAETGAELWRIETPYPVFSPPTAARGKVFVGMGNGNFIDSAEQVMARELRRLREQGKSDTELAELEKQLGPAGEVWCIDAATRQVDWRFPVTRTVLGAVAAGKDGLFFGSRDGHLYSVSYEGTEIGRWNARAPILNSPAVTDEHVYFVTERGHLYALAISGLQPVWDYVLGTEGRFLSSPAVARGRVYVGSEENGLLCVGARGEKQEKAIWAGSLGGPGRCGSIESTPLPDRGALIWRYPKSEGTSGVQVSITAPAACLNDLLVVPLAVGSTKGLVALESGASSPETPGERWLFTTSNGVYLSAAMTEQFVLCVDGGRGDSNRFLYCLEAKTGIERWRHPVAPDVSGDFILHSTGASPDHGDLVYIQDQPGNLTCLDMSGSVLWREKVGLVCQSPACRDSILIAAIESPPSLQARDAMSGTMLWETDLDSVPHTGPAIEKGVLYVGTAKGIAAHDLITGTILWQSKTGSVERAFGLGESWIAYVNSDAELVLVDPKDGSLGRKVTDVMRDVPPLRLRDAVLYASRGGLWILQPSESRARRWTATSWLGRISSPLISANGRVYFATDGKGLICAGGR